jgi:hypothetical protein
MIKLFIFIIISTFLLSCLNENKTSKTEEFVCGVKEENSFNIDNVENQPNIYRRKCSACHQINKDGTGPKLVGAFNKMPNEKWFELYIKNEDSLIKNGDLYTTEISNFSELNNVHNFNDITSEEISVLKKYIRGK